MSISKYIELSPLVKDALDKNKPIVALESTIISHGMPYPDNVKTALELETIINEKGAVPATIAIINGKIKIGLNKDEIEFLGTSKEVEKVSRRDFPYVVGFNKNGATTVAGTMICANWAGIKFFATGGIGGVHRGYDRNLDISADLYELMQTNVAVICAGVKSILDIPNTLEYLETLGVPVIGYKTDIFPAFYTRNSNCKVDFRFDSPEDIAKFTFTKWDLSLKGGILISNPVPEKFEMNENEINLAITEALKKGESLGIQGKKITPFLLDKIKEITFGKSLETNIELVKNNVHLATDIAISYKNLYK